jgi:hypothetical protein
MEADDLATMTDHVTDATNPRHRACRPVLMMTAHILLQAVGTIGPVRRDEGLTGPG